MTTGSPNDQHHPDVVAAADSPLAAVRHLETWYFGESGFSARKAIDYLLEEADLCGVPDLRVTYEDGWWILESDKDWLSDLAEMDVFMRPVRYMEGGPNGTRTEVLLTAFADAVVTIARGRTCIVTDTVGVAKRWLDQNTERFRNVRRVIAFYVG